MFGPKLCLLPGFAYGSSTNAGREAGYIVRQVYRRVTVSALRPMPDFDHTAREKLAALVAEAREIRAEADKLRQKSEALKQQIAQIRRERRESRLKNKK